MEERQHLISIVATIWILSLLYLPKCLLTFIFIQLLVAAIVVLFTLLRMMNKFRDGNQQLPNSKSRPKSNLEDGFDSIFQLISASASTSELDSWSDHKPHYADSFVEWDVRAPLEVIYEEESENEDENGGNYLQRHGSLSKYFPESDSDSSSSGEYPDWDNKACFKWDEDDANGLIEIALEDKKGLSFFNEEENMIEIDISQASSSRIPMS